MAENTRTFQEILLEQRNTNKELASLKQENRLMSDVLKDIKEDAVKDSTNQGILRSALPEILADTGNTNRQLSEFDQQQVTFGNIASGIREMVGVSEDTNTLLKDIVKQNDEFYADQEAEEERAAALKESKKDKGLEDGKGEFGKKLKDSVSGVFGGLKGIFFGTAGIFAALFAFVAALGNEKFREVIFKATDAVGKAFVDFGELIEGDKGLLEFLRENALTLAGITTLLMPKRTFGLLFGAVTGLSKGIKFLAKNFKNISSFFRIFTPILGRFFLPLGLIIESTTGAVKAIDSAYEKFKETGNLLDALNLGFSTFVGYLISLPARIFKTLIDGALGLLEFITFGWLNFDTIQQKIRDLDFVGIITDAIYNVLTSADDFIRNTLFNVGQFLIDMKAKLDGFTLQLLEGIVNFAKNVGKKIYDPETGAILGVILPPFPTLGDIGQFLKDKAKLIYDPETNAIFGYQLPELPSISGMFDMLKDFGKKIYDPETGEIFGFKLPSLSDLNPLKNFSLPGFLGGDKDDEPTLSEKIAALDGPTSFKDAGLLDLFGIDPDDPKEVKLTPLDEFLNEPTAKEQYKEMMRKMNELQERLYEEAGTVQQINVVKGGDSVNQSSSTGFSTKKSAYNDDYTMQALAGSMP